LVSFEALRSRGLSLRLGAQTAVVACLEDLIASKEACGRPKDLAQLPVLRETLRVSRAVKAIVAKPSTSAGTTQDLNSTQVRGTTLIQ
jgi:hypothetical protein